MISPATEQVRNPTNSSKEGAETSRLKMLAVNTKLLNWSGIVFVLLQSACTAVIAISGVRVAIGLSALAAAAGIHAPAHGFHQDAIRIPMMVFAFLGAVINLFVIWKVRRLRSRPASQNKEKTQLRTFSDCSFRTNPASPRRRMDHSPHRSPRPLTFDRLSFFYFFSFKSSSGLSSSFASRSCSRSLYPTGNSNVRSSAVKTRIFRVESSIAEQISQCSRCRSISSRSFASTLPSMYSEMCSQTCLQSSFIALSRRTACVPEPSFSGMELGAFAASSAPGAAALSLRQDLFPAPAPFPPR